MQALIKLNMFCDEYMMRYSVEYQDNKVFKNNFSKLIKGVYWNMFDYADIVDDDGTKVWIRGDDDKEFQSVTIRSCEKFADNVASKVNRSLASLHILHYKGELL